MNIKIISVIFVGYLVAITISSIGNIVVERYQVHVAEDVLYPILGKENILSMERKDLHKLVSDPKFKVKYAENMRLHESKLMIFSIVSFSIQLFLLLSIAIISGRYIRRITSSGT